MSSHWVFFLVAALFVYSVPGCNQRKAGDVAYAPDLRNDAAPKMRAAVESMSPERVRSIDVGPSRAPAKITAFSENATIGEGDTYEVVVVKGNSTKLTVSGASIDELILKDTCRVSVDGGVIKEVYIYDHCEALISGGKIGVISGYGKNTLTIKGGAEIAALHAYGATQVVVDSDDAAIEAIRYFTKCGCVDQSQKANLEFSRGRLRNIGTGATEVTLTVIGLDLKKLAYGGAYGYGSVSGRWENGKAFSIHLADASTFSHIVLRELWSTLEPERQKQ